MNNDTLEHFGVKGSVGVVENLVQNLLWVVN